MLDRPCPTDEQTHICNLARDSVGNIMINALAGTGKTTTLEMISGVLKARPCLYLVFNKRNAEEAEGRFPSITTVRTFNSLGHRVWAKTQARPIKLNPDKPRTILVELIKEFSKADQSACWQAYWEIINGVNRARALGYVPEGLFPQAKRLLSRTAFHDSLEEEPSDLVADLIDAVLARSIQQAYAGVIDFNDQIYMPTLFGGTFPRFPVIKVDEYQDLNPVNHAMLDKLAKDRLIGVGDPWQSIYAFRGARQGGMAEAVHKFKMTECDLSISFRCPRAVVEAVRWHVPKFKWIKEGGHVEVLKSLDASDIPDNSAILCRNNAPLFRMAIHLLMAKRSVSVAGSEIGPKIVGIMKKLGAEATSQAATKDLIEAWREARLAKNSSTANDIADCMQVFASFGQTLGQAIAYAEHLFKQRGTIRLLTGHKAKGLEFDIVFHLDPWLIGDSDQEHNLRYVISTRSKDQLYEINSQDIRWDNA